MPSKSEFRIPNSERTPKKEKFPCVLTIAGSDSGGGAGIQADLKTFAALRVHGTCAITCLTAQNPKTVIAVEPVRPEMVRRQIEAVFTELNPRAVKSGMLYSRAIITAVARTLAEVQNVPLVVDPVMISTSGSALLKSDAVKALRESLIPRATLLTPNLDEVQALIGMKIHDVEQARTAAHWIHTEWGCAALVKGGHLRGMKEAVDIYFDGREELLLSAPYIRNVSTHGTGCTYSAAIVAGLARGLKLRSAVIAAKEYITQAIAGSRRVGTHQVLW